MQQLESLEQALVGMFKDAPHLPKGLREWLVDNAWWLVLIGVMLSGLGIVATLPFMSVGLLFWGFALSGFVALAVMVATTIIEAMAIQPLKEKRKRGWDLLFLASLVSLLGSLARAVLDGRAIGGAIAALVGAAIGLYVLFELRGHYLPGGQAQEAEVIPPRPKK